MQKGMDGVGGKGRSSRGNVKQGLAGREKTRRPRRASRARVLCAQSINQTHPESR